MRDYSISSQARGKQIRVLQNEMKLYRAMYKYKNNKNHKIIKQMMVEQHNPSID